MPVHQHILNWLYSVLTSEYQDINRAYHDIAQVLCNHPGLSPQTDVYTYTNGESALLLRLSGTLPVEFLGVTYRFPISVWVPHKYPREPPLAYVSPTGDMTVRPGQHVDPQGQIYHPYLNHWSSFWDKSTLLDFLVILSDVFAKEPPVVSRSQTTISSMHTLTGLSAQRHQQQHGRPNPDTEPPPLPPPPPGIKHDSHVYQSQRGADAMVPPPLPPKQIVAVGSLHQGHNRSASQGREEDVRTSILLPAVPSCSKFDGVQGIQPQPSSEKHHVSNLRYSTAPALPSLYGSPPSVPNQRPSQHTDSSEGGTVQISVSRSPNLHDGGVEGMKLNPADASRMSQEDTVIRPSWRSPLVPLHDVLRGQHHGKPDARSSSQLQSSSAPLMLPDLLDEPTPRASVSPMVPVAPPPVPPNPQKDALVRQLASTLFSMRQATRRQDELSLGGLAAQHAAIRTATAKLQTEFDMLSQLSSLLMSNTSILHDSLRKADIVIERSRSHPETEIDDLLVAPTVVGNQLYTLVAEERAIGDAMFAISRAMEKGRISAAVFTKCTRSLAREWYIKKALIREITLGMGLSPGH